MNKDQFQNGLLCIGFCRNIVRLSNNKNCFSTRNASQLMIILCSANPSQTEYIVSQTCIWYIYSAENPSLAIEHTVECLWFTSWLCSNLGVIAHGNHPVSWENVLLPIARPRKHYNSKIHFLINEY